MEFVKFCLGQCGAGTVVQATLSGVESDVFLVDAPNFRAFESGQSYHCTGGHYRQSPVRLATPSTGDWTMVVVPVGGRVQASFRILTAA